MNIPTPNEVIQLKKLVTQKQLDQECQDNDLISKKVMKKLTPKIMNVIMNNSTSLSIRLFLKQQNSDCIVDIIKKVLSDFEDKGWRFSLYKSYISDDHPDFYHDDDIVNISPFSFYSPLFDNFKWFYFILRLSDDINREDEIVYSTQY
jgi:hypothetical protein